MITEYVKGTPYFTDTESKIKQYPYLDTDIDCDVLIIGGGIDGAICSYYLSNANIKVVLIEKARLGHMSTSCATALLEYQLDDHANDLTKYLKKDEIITAYKIGLRSLSDIESFISKKGNACHYSQRPTLMFSQKNSEIEELVREYQFRKSNDFKAEFIDEKNNPFNFEVKAGIYCEDGGAEFNPYLFQKQMVEAAEKNGTKFYENTEAVSIKYGKTENIVLTQYQNRIKCKKVVCATGYNTKLFTSKQLCTKFISYSIVTSSINDFGWYKNTLLQDNSDPYHYMRLSPDNRIILGGEDILFKNDTISDETANKKYALLEEYMHKLFPNIKNRVTIDYKFCGAFSSTLDNLAVFGPSADNENLWYCVGYGANGIIYSIVGSQMLAKLYNEHIDENLYLFSPDRKLI